ncbi:MAG TPA: tripartite tricarboxylate transporter substrate binding protein [Casimicrobiaceae bacterium]|nr:tripartite tricarboxylate transporter substrate binding protein [Casimicrobiaceae bacterium]
MLVRSSRYPRLPLVLAGALAAAALAFGALVAPAAAQGFPSKPVKLVIPFPPGGSLDNVGRLLAQKLSEAWGQQVVIENKPGAGGNIGADAVAKSPPDGYTVVMGALSTHAVNPSLYKTMPYDAVRDFAPLSLVAITPNVLIVKAGMPIASVKDLVAYAKANPGKTNFGSGSNGSAGHLAGELFKLETGTDVMHIPYKGGAPALQALLAGDTQFMFDNLANAMAQVKGGTVRAIAVTTAQRSKLAPDLPTMAEAGLPGFDISTWFGLMAPAGTPPEVVARWNEGIVKALNSPDVREKMLAQGAEPAPMTPTEFAAFIARERDKYARIVKASGAKVD